MKITGTQRELLEKAAKAMCGGTIEQYPELLTILRERSLIYSSEYDQPVNRFIPEFREILANEV